MIDDWLNDFYAEHLARHPRAGLPPLATEEGAVVYRAWRSTFLHRGISDYDVATVASERLTGERLPHSSEHFPRLCELAVEIYKLRQAEGGSGETPHTREAAGAASRGCERCSGQGLAVILGTTERHGEIVEYAASAHCVCPMGRWLRAALAKSRDGEAAMKRIPDLGRLPYGWRELRDDFDDRPAPAGFDPRAALRSPVDAHKLALPKSSALGLAARAAFNRAQAAPAKADPTPADLARAEASRAAQAEALRRYAARGPEPPAF